MSQARFQKVQREKARRAKAAAKRERREERRAIAAEQPEAPSTEDQSALLAELAALHERFEAERISFDDFAAAKEELTERLDIR